MPWKIDQDSARQPKRLRTGKGRGAAEKTKWQPGKGKDKMLANPWAYKITLPNQNKHDKCSMSDLVLLDCRTNFMIKPLPAEYTEETHDEDLYRIFSGLVNQGVCFMRQWVHCFTLTHKGFITNLVKTYLKSKGLKLGTWLKGIKDGRRPDILGLFLLCVIMGTHCFVHTRAGIWTTLFKEPSTHQELIQQCNLHLGYLGHGIYVEFIPRTETVSFEIFGLPKPVSVNMDSKPVTLGTLTADEEGTLCALLSTCTALHSASSLTSTQVELKSPITPTREKTSTEDPSAHSQSNIKIDSSTPYPGDQAQQLTSNSEVNTDNSHIDMAQHSVLDSTSNQHKAEETAQPTSTGDDPAQQTVVINAPDKEDNSISAELVRAIIGNQPQLVLTHKDHKDTKGNGDRTLDAKMSSNLDNILSAE